jgi:hypothetical protein
MTRGEVLLATVASAVGFACLVIAYEVKKLLRLWSEHAKRFDALYPVFTREQIDRCQRDHLKKAALYETLWQQIQDRDDFKVFVISNELKVLMGDCTLAKLEAEHLFHLNSLQIEGNAAVFSGVKTVENVRRTFNDAFWNHGEHVIRACKLCNKWIDSRQRGETQT